VGGILKPGTCFFGTSEARKKDALMVLPYDQARVEEAGRHFDETVRRIQAQEFSVINPPEAAICKECDIRMLCRAEGIFGAPVSAKEGSSSEVTIDLSLPSSPRCA
jgi:hypothetical protein